MNKELDTKADFENLPIHATKLYYLAGAAASMLLFCHLV